jgi:hypothetical protein
MAFDSVKQFTFATSDNNAQIGAVSVRLADAADSAVVVPALATAFGGLVNGLVKEKTYSERLLDPLRLIGPAVSNKTDYWRVYALDSVTGRIFSFRIPTANRLLRATGSDNMDKTLGAYTAFKAAIEANAVSPDGNAFTLFEEIVFE